MNKQKQIDDAFTRVMTERLSNITGDDSFRAIARRTGFHPETVRRYMQGVSKQSLEFVASVVNEYDADASVLMRGHPVAPSEDSLRLASTDDLFAELSRRLAHVEGRISSLAEFIQRADSKSSVRGEVVTSRFGKHPSLSIQG